MFKITNQGLFIFFFLITVALLYLLAPILTPFLFGALLAFLMDPVVKKLERFRLPHILSVTITFCLLFLVIALLILMMVPLIQRQFNLLVDQTPRIIAWTQNIMLPWVKESTYFDTIKTTLAQSLPKAGSILTAMLVSSYTIIEKIVAVVLTPVVLFYLLRDWDPIRKNVVDIFPKSMRPTVIELSTQCGEVLSAFFRGQLLVMFALAIYYGMGLTIIGLQLGLTIGVLGGLLSIVPYLGSAFVLIGSCIAAMVQWGDWHALIPVVIVYLIGQGLEGYVLTPYLVGERIGLHPVAVIFAILAGGTLFGFFGVLLALPVSAMIVVTLRYVRHNIIEQRHAK